MKLRLGIPKGSLQDATVQLFARSDEPVSVTSTIASASTGGFTSVAPQLNSTLADTPCDCR